MSRYIKWAVITICVTGIFIYSFSVFGRYLIDYSLETLGFAMEITTTDFDETNFLERHIYQNVMEGLALEEASRGDADLQNLLLIETASQSLEDPSELAGFYRARVYLDRVMDKKKEAKDWQSQLKRTLHRLYYRIQPFIASIVRYLQKRAGSRTEQVFQISDQLLLTQAQEREKAGEIGEAQKLYEQYLQLYGDRPDHGLVSIALANILIELNEWDKSEAILKPIRGDYLDRKEGRAAAVLLNRIRTLKKRRHEIEKYLSELPKYEGTAGGDTLHYKLGISYLALQKFDDAVKHFSAIQKIDNAKLRQRAQFYLGWLYKLKNERHKADGILKNLLSEENLEQELQLASRAELANLKMSSGDYQAAEFFYESIEKEVKQDTSAEKGILKAWSGIAELENSIASVQMGKEPNVNKVLTHFEGLDLDKETRTRLERQIQKTASQDLRMQAFNKLKEKKPDQAANLFKKFLLGSPKDGWANSGLGTCYLLLEDLDRAEQFAEEGYKNIHDAYTASVLAYIYSKQGRHKEAINLYRNAIMVKKDYETAQYNLMGEYLKAKDFKRAYDLAQEMIDAFKYSANVQMRAKILNNLGVALWGMGRKSDAAEAFKEALLLHPKFTLAEENLREIQLGDAPTDVAETALATQ